MGYSERNNGAILDYEPDNTAKMFYIRQSASLSEIIEQIKDKWGDVSFDDILITSEYIHTECLTYDLYDSSDYTNYLCIENIGE